ncbi:hypothetical protein AAC387_Pa11g0762 [Persea americana]
MIALRSNSPQTPSFFAILIALSSPPSLLSLLFQSRSLSLPFSSCIPSYLNSHTRKSLHFSYPDEFAFFPKLSFVLILEGWTNTIASNIVYQRRGLPHGMGQLRRFSNNAALLERSVLRVIEVLFFVEEIPYLH